MSQTLCRTQFTCPPVVGRNSLSDLNTLFAYDPDDPTNRSPRGPQNARRHNRTLKQRRRMAKRSRA